MGISGGKDSAALAIYMKDKYPQLDIEYYCCDTGKELEETYTLIRNLEVYLGRPIIRLEAASNSHEDPFDHFLKLYGGYLPSSTSRWCTRKLKLEPFEKWIGDDLVVSYVGIRGDEDREGYISKKPTVQSIFPFRKNIWSEDVIAKTLNNNSINFLAQQYAKQQLGDKLPRILELVHEPISESFTLNNKLQALLEMGAAAFNQVVFDYLATTKYPIANTPSFPLVENEDVLVRDDIFRILRESGVGVPQYYEKLPYEVDGKKGEYARSRSGCYFCFFQQKIEWIWLYEQHPEMFEKAMQYEKDGYTWMQEEKLEDIIKPERMHQIKSDQLLRDKRNKKKSPYLLDILDEVEDEGCASCFI